ncbi:hypothetical protein ACFX11_003526 [Malus domestica]
MAVLNRVLRSQQPGSFFSLRSFRSYSSRFGASVSCLYWKQQIYGELDSDYEIYMFKGHGDIYDPYCKPETFKNYHPYSSNNSSRAQPYIFGVIYSGVAVPAWEAGRSLGVSSIN